jgi:hypothetical protein
MRLTDLNRNDVAGAIQYVEAVLDSGRDVGPDEGQVLAMLQDDSGRALATELGKVYARRAASDKRVPARWKARHS